MQQSSIDNTMYLIYPNPTAGKINIQIATSKLAQLINVEMYDLVGRTVLKQAVIYNPNENTNSINISSLPSGSYFLKLISNDGITSKPIRIIKSN